MFTASSYGWSMDKVEFHIDFCKFSGFDGKHVHLYFSWFINTKQNKHHSQA